MRWNGSAPDHSALQIAKYCVNSISKSATAAECAVIARGRFNYTHLEQDMQHRDAIFGSAVEQGRQHFHLKPQQS
jgi:hypothetical protein